MHPKDKYERRSIEAKALEKKIFRQRRIDGKKRKLKTQITEQETYDELRRVTGGHPVPGTALRADQTEAVFTGVRED